MAMVECAVLFIVTPENRESLGSMTLSALLDKKGVRNAIVDTDARRIADAVRSFYRSGARTIVLAYSVVSVFARQMFDVNLRIRGQFPRVAIMSLFGGMHPTFCPDMIAEEGVDALCRGEGEEAFIEFMDAVIARQDYAAIQNWWVKKGATIYKNQVRPLIADLDTLPFPSRKYSSSIRSFRQGKASMITSRGCAFDCAYCFNHAYKKLYGPAYRIRRRSVPNVIEEAGRLAREHRIRYIVFQDDSFAHDPVWVEEFARAYKKKVGLPFGCLVHPLQITKDAIRSLKDAGCVVVAMGIECGNERLRRSSLKRFMTNKDILTAAQTVNDAGILLRTQTLINIPGSTWETELENLRLNIQCRPYLARASILSSYPGTEMAEKKMRDASSGGQPSLGHSGSNWYIPVTELTGAKRRKMENLSALYTLFVLLPGTQAFMRVLLRLPMKFLYSRINKFFESDMYLRFSKKARGF